MPLAARAVHVVAELTARRESLGLDGRRWCPRTIPATLTTTAIAAAARRASSISVPDSNPSAAVTNPARRTSLAGVQRRNIHRSARPLARPRNARNASSHGGEKYPAYSPLIVGRRAGFRVPRESLEDHSELGTTISTDWAA